MLASILREYAKFFFFGSTEYTIPESGRSLGVYLGGGMVKHLLPGWVHGVPVSQEALLCHIHHLSGCSVHGHSPLISQSCLLRLLLGLGKQTAAAKKTFNPITKSTATEKSVQSFAGLFSNRLPPKAAVQIVHFADLKNIFKTSKRPFEFTI